MATKRNSLVANINRRKRRGTKPAENEIDGVQGFPRTDAAGLAKESQAASQQAPQGHE